MNQSDLKQFKELSDKLDEQERRIDNQSLIITAERERIAALESLLKEAGKMLESIQWNDWNEVDGEPACAILCDRDGDHSPDCPLASLIERIEEAGK